MVLYYAVVTRNDDWKISLWIFHAHTCTLRAPTQDTPLMAHKTNESAPAVFVQNITAKRQIREVGTVNILENSFEKSVCLVFNDKQFLVDKESYFIYPRLDQENEFSTFCVRFKNMAYLELTVSTKRIRRILDCIFCNNK